MASRFTYILLVGLLVLALLPSPTAAFGAGNIASISKVEGQNFRHGDIEDFLKTVAFLRGKKWTSMMIKRVYFGNWLRDYSQAVDVGTLKGVQAETIRILVWILAFMSFGYATEEFEVTADRLGVYRPEEHIDNPKDYADNVDARQYDQRLRGPVMPEELAIDPYTGMKNYISNEQGGWATSSGYIKYSFQRSIHFGRVYTSGSSSGRDEDLCEAMRCLGQGLHCLEDFGAHTNYTELALRELGFSNVFPHTGTNTMMNIQGKHVFPLVTGTFGGVDFLHSVLGEATDHFTQSEVSQSEVDNLNVALGNASAAADNKKSIGGETNCDALTSVLSKVPGAGGLCQEAQSLQAMSDQQAAMNYNTQRDGSGGGVDPYSATRTDATQQAPAFAGPPGSVGGPPAPGIPGMNPNLDPTTIVPKIYPILAFRDKVVRAISAVISKIPGLESLVEQISERLSVFVFSLLAPFVRPLIAAASNSLKTGSSTVVNASAKAQYGPWDDPNCTDPTHSLLSKDHFSNILNEPAGKVAASILQYTAPRVIYAWQNPDIPVDQVLNDVARIFHHPALRDMNNECHRNMFQVVERWVHERKSGSTDLNVILSSESVKAGKNHIGANIQESLEPGMAFIQQAQQQGGGQHTMAGGLLGHGGGSSGNPLASLLGGGSHGSSSNPLSFFSGGNKNSSSPFNFLSTKRDIDDFAEGGAAPYDPSGGLAPGQQYDQSYSGAQPYTGHTPQPYQYGQPEGYAQAAPQQDQYAYQGGYQQGYQQQPQEGDFGNWNPNATGPYGRGY
ncbi:heterokaryon incompatibility Het-C [Rhizodiscina lignyota]|uniref:Heterokaryon incompatibility Het-C n=1 Tax=Rhizodiscina lignyota TaxID=1504668 RepID=A0A9P4I3U7_9PEZI|nr:heterokaryon incompatibility Het-C [Rhizodiscina lignyota]